MNLRYSGIGFLKPFPHTIIDNFLSIETVEQINNEWPDAWQIEEGSFNKKWNTQQLPPTARAVVDAVNLSAIEKITGINNLIADPELFGAGLHCIPSNGFLKRHVDFNIHPNGWHRRVNMLIYLNRVWRDEWNGHLELGLANPIKISPVAGRCVIFETTADSWHGHPKPLACPETIQRRSLALYFYTEKTPNEEPHSTIYKK